MTRTLLATTLVIATVSVVAQDYRSGVDLVTIPLVVTNRSGVPVTGPIAPADFRVFEDGVEQTVTLLDRERLPTSVCIVLDSSMSMRGWKQRLATAAIDHVFRRLRADDEAAMVIFSAGIRQAMPWLPGPKVPPMNWDRWRVGGTTPLLDALLQAIRLMNDAVNPRGVILVVSDGLDNSSRTTLSQIATTRRQSETLVYAVRTDELSDPAAGKGQMLEQDGPAFAADSAKDVLATLVGDSGGVVYSVSVPQRAEAAARAFFDDLESQYVLGYVPKRPPDGTYRRLKVEPINEEWRVRHRGGYLAQPVPPRPR